MKASLEKTTPDDIEVWPCMVPAVSLFMAMGTQWRWVGAGQAGAFRTGLDYSALGSVAGPLGVMLDADTLHDLRTLEGGALEVMNKR